MTDVSRRGVFPGSFNPLTVAHLEIAHIARETHTLHEVVLVVSSVALDKPSPPGPSLGERIELIRADLAGYDWLRIEQSNKQLIADLAEGFDVVIMGADKWEQLHDPRYYESEDAMYDALRRLPVVAVAPRDGIVVNGADTLDTSPASRSVSSTDARAGDRTLMAPHAAKHWTHTNESGP
ncbi:MAG: hypothetical protein KJO18_04230 [Acidimicrobiia bacterium]|nr:hypothetical protein [Acidimicrobiia bacterium]